jgi:hypothetical protein
MRTTEIVVTALPVSAATAAPVHVSLHLSIRLTPEAQEELLERFHVVSDLGDHLRGASFALRSDHGPIAATPELAAIDPRFWGRLFPPARTPVRKPARPPLDGRSFRSFGAADVHDLAIDQAVASMRTDPLVPPTATTSPLRELTAELSGVEKVLFPRQRGLGDALEVIPAWEHDARAVIAAGHGDGKTAKLARVHEFYRRPAQDAYRERPDPSAKGAPVPKKLPEFHERCTLVGDHPWLQRRLGLVVDLRVDDLAALRAATWIAADLVVGGVHARAVRVAVERRGDALYAAPSTKDWVRGRLALGDTHAFSALAADADGNALKLDNVVWSIPRILAAEANGDPVDAATPALRTNGFAIARRDRSGQVSGRIERNDAIAAAVKSGDQPLLHAEDVTRGVRLEVWDDGSRAWRSVHERIVDYADDEGRLGETVVDSGFAKGAAVDTHGSATDVYLHESIVGWDGWSLSAPRPGARTRREDGAEKVDTAEEALPGFLRVHARVRPGTLPRLRYGVKYAFRAWAVDLAGNSPPHALPAPSHGHAAPSAGAPAAVEHAGPVPILEAADPFGAPATGAPAGAPPTITGDAAVDQVLFARIASRRARAAAPSGRAGAVRRRFSTAQPLAAMQVRASGHADRAALEAAEAAAGFLPAADALESVLRTVAPLQTFFRWDPVAPPVIVPRRPYTEGESARTLVIRSDVRVEGDLDHDGKVVVGTPEDWAAAHPGYGATSERHLAPPQTGFGEAERHGRFDDAIGVDDAARHRRALLVALREAGSFLETAVSSLDTPGAQISQPGVSIQGTPAGKTPTSLTTRERGAPLQQGEYVVHDTGALRVPYLPDPLARGVSLVFPDARANPLLKDLLGVEGLTAVYGGAWPEREPFRLVLAAGERLRGEVDGRAIDIAIPPGEQLRVHLSSSLAPKDLDLLGLWAHWPAELRSDPLVIEAAADGWLWALTPAEALTLVHAVPRPVEAPRPTVLFPTRKPGATTAILHGGVDVHGPSTERIDAEASWTEPLDDVAAPAPGQEERTGHAFTVKVAGDDDLVIIGAESGQTISLLDQNLKVHASVHAFGDTRHRKVTYRFRGTTRYRELFDPKVAGDPSIVGPATLLSIPSSARPAPPAVHAAMPLFRWEERTEPAQPFGLERRRRPGVRIYLDRPWFSSGEGELLGVLFFGSGETGDSATGSSVWGADPAWKAGGPPHRLLTFELADLARAIGFENRSAPGRPVRVAAGLPHPTAGGVTSVAGFTPRFDEGSRRWAVDVAVDTGEAYFPFLRLVLCRYQPDALPGMALSTPVVCDFVQLVAERTATVSRPDDRQVHVTVAGPVGIHDTPMRDRRTGTWTLADRVVRAHLQRLDPSIGTDLGWRTLRTVDLALVDIAPTGEAAWTGALELPEAVAPRTPGESREWRVQIEELERIPTDPGKIEGPAAHALRLVYLDEVPL